MTATLIANPGTRLAARIGPDEMEGTDPYGLGFCVSRYSNTGEREIAVYDIGGGMKAFIGYSDRYAYSLVVQDAIGTELAAGKFDHQEAVLEAIAPYLS